jgi:glycolate oxidase subunit GlcD
MLNDFIQILSKQNVLTDQHSLTYYGKDWLSNYTPNSSAILLPENTTQVQEVLKYCSKNKIVIIPSGGRTGLSGGATALNGEVIISLEKLNKNIEINKVERTLTCDAGVITQRVQEEAEKHDLYFPIDFASKGSSQIGGNIATNAGGIRVIKYGNIRDWVLGLEVVLPSGQLLNLNGPLIKNNSGYDLRNLIIGSEGTLAIITKVILKLTKKPTNLLRTICGLNKLEDINQLLTNIRDLNLELSAFEFFPRNALDLVLKHHKLVDPLSAKANFYVLMEFENVDTSIQNKIEETLSNYIEQGLVVDAVISQNQKQLNELLNYRELIPETLNANFKLYKNDISVPISSIPKFLESYEQLIKKNYPDFEIVTFGHIGDGNLHLNILKPEHIETKQFVDKINEVNDKLYQLIKDFNGSISAEHGVGLVKKPYLHYSRSEEDINLMRAIKKAFDPNLILNPGKIFDLV